MQVYGSSGGGQIKLTVCIEDHKFSPKNFWCVTNHAVCIRRLAPATRVCVCVFCVLGMAGGDQSGLPPLALVTLSNSRDC